MSEDPRHPWGTGATHYHWDPDVANVVQRLRKEFPAITANTYTCHPWCGWAGRSVDVWGRGGRGDSIGRELGQSSLDFLFNLSYGPWMRHWIFEHTIWTSWGGKSRWSADDHSGRLRHVHVTYYPVPSHF